MILHLAKWEKPKKRPTKRELVAQYRNNSECVVSFVIGENLSPDLVHIEFHGDLARIPSLKNSKLPKSNFTNPEFEARIIAMEHLFLREVQRQGIQLPTFGSTHVMVAVVCGKRSRSFDPLNCTETVQDWLEPSQKMVGQMKNRRKRGWGVGLIENDSQCTPFPLHSWQTGIPHEHTVIVIRPWDKVRECALTFLSQLLIGAGGAKENV